MDWFIYSWPTLSLLGLGLRMAIHLHYGARGPDDGDPVFVLLSISSWVLLLFGILPAMLAGLFSFVGLIVFILAATALVDAVVQRRATQRRSMCSLLGLLVGRGQQIDSSVLLSGSAGRGAVGRAMRRLLAAVKGGMPLATAIERYPAALPREAIAYAAAGETMQSEAAALKELSRADHSELSAVWRGCIDRISYLAAVLLMMGLVATFLMIKIVPEFRKIFQEFDVELPHMTELAISISGFVEHYLLAPLLLFGLIVVVGALVVGGCYLFDIHVLAGVGDMLFRGRRAADVLRIMAVATDERQPLPGVLARLGKVYPAVPIRKRIAPAAAAVASGVDWRDALANVGLLTAAEQGLLKTAERAGNLPWALRTIARRNEKRAVYRMTAAVQILYPLVILGLGLLIGFFVVSLFIPLVKLIEALC